MVEFTVNDVIEFFPTGDNWPRVDDGETYGYAETGEDVDVYGGTIGKVYDNVTIDGVAEDTLRRGDTVTIGGIDYTVDALRAATAGVIVTEVETPGGPVPRPHIDTGASGGSKPIAEARLVPVDGGDTRFVAFLLGEWQSFSGEPLSGEITQIDMSGVAPVRATRGEFVTFTRSTEDYNLVCFVAGTCIATARGEAMIETLKVGDRVLTRDGRLCPIRWIGRRRLSRAALAAHPRLRPVRIAANALGRGLPRQDLFVSRQHRILVRSQIAARMFGAADVLLPAHKLLVLDGVSLALPEDGVEYWHMLFDQHEVVVSNGALTESLFTGPEALKALPPEAREEIATLFPQITRPGFQPVAASRIPDKGKQMKRLVARHQKNGKPLQPPRAAPCWHDWLEAAFPPLSADEFAGASADPA